MPYNLLIQSGARESLGIDLKDSIVVVDEAHNLIDSLNSCYSTLVTFEQLEEGLLDLKAYVSKYRIKLSPQNLLSLRNLTTIVGNFLKYLKGRRSKMNIGDEEEEKQETQNEGFSIVNFLRITNSSQINLFELSSFLQRSKLSQKLIGIGSERRKKSFEASASSERKMKSFPQHLSSFHFIQPFLESLTNSNENGKVIVQDNKMFKVCIYFTLFVDDSLIVCHPSILLNF